MFPFPMCKFIREEDYHVSLDKYKFYVLDPIMSHLGNDLFESK